MWIVPVWKHSARSLSSALQKGGRKRPLVASSIGKGVAALSLMWMPHVRQPDLEPDLVIQRSQQRDADSMRSVHQATNGASEGKWYAHVR